MEPAQLRADIEQFFSEVGIPEDRALYSSSYFGMVDLHLGNGMEIYAAALLIAVVCAIVIYNIFYISIVGKMREYGRLTMPRLALINFSRNRKRHLLPLSP